MGKGLWIGLAALFAAAALSVFGLYRLTTAYVDFDAASSELPAAVAAYRRDGLPFVASDLFASRPRPEENAAPAIRAAVLLLPPKAAATRLTAELRRTDAGADALLARAYRMPLDAIGRAVDLPKVDFQRDWDLGPYVRLPEYGSMKVLAKAAVLRAVREAARGGDASALRDLTLARKLGVWAGQEPCLISPLVRFSLEMIALDGAERCLCAAAGRPERIARYAAWLMAAPPLPDFRLALRGEAFLGVTTARNLVPLGGVRTLLDASGDGLVMRVDPQRLRREGVPPDEKARAYLARCLQLWDEAYKATQGLSQTPEAMGRRLNALLARQARKVGLSYALDRVLVSDFGRAGESVTNLAARRAVEAGFAEALTDHALTGRWPTRVAGTDPFTGGPLKVRRGKDFRVWSVGRDRKDDGGLLRREASKKPGATFDEVAVYPPVPR